MSDLLNQYRQSRKQNGGNSSTYKDNTVDSLYPRLSNTFDKSPRGRREQLDDKLSRFDLSPPRGRLGNLNYKENGKDNENENEILKRSGIGRDPSSWRSRGGVSRFKDDRDLPGTNQNEIRSEFLNRVNKSTGNYRTNDRERSPSYTSEPKNGNSIDFRTKRYEELNGFKRDRSYTKLSLSETLRPTMNYNRSDDAFGNRTTGTSSIRLSGVHSNHDTLDDGKRDRAMPSYLTRTTRLSLNNDDDRITGNPKPYFGSPIKSLDETLRKSRQSIASFNKYMNKNHRVGKSYRVSKKPGKQVTSDKEKNRGLLSRIVSYFNADGNGDDEDRSDSEGEDAHKLEQGLEHKVEHELENDDDYRKYRGDDGHRDRILLRHIPARNRSDFVGNSTLRATIKELEDLKREHKIVLAQLEEQRLENRRLLRENKRARLEI
ncbi:hypothetical protein PP707_00860 [Acetobacter pasteurianus]|nr:hypothetical protein [Acetobacter pasteurianus]